MGRSAPERVHHLEGGRRTWTRRSKSSGRAPMRMRARRRCSLGVQGPSDRGGGRPSAMEQQAELATDKHVRYIVTAEKKKDSFESLVMEHIQLNGAYWGLTTLDLLHRLHTVDVAEVTDWKFC